MKHRRCRLNRLLKHSRKLHPDLCPNRKPRPSRNNLSGSRNLNSRSGLSNPNGSSLNLNGSSPNLSGSNPSRNGKLSLSLNLNSSLSRNSRARPLTSCGPCC